VDAEALRLARSEVVESAALTAIPGAMQCVNVARRRPWAIVTSGGRELATTRLRIVGLPLPDVLVAAEDVNLGKPDPEPYALASRRLAVAASDCVAVEDAPAGIEAAKASGMRVLAVSTTHPAAALSDADALFASMLDLARALPELLDAPFGLLEAEALG
jgi:sugar-phosphatase